MNLPNQRSDCLRLGLFGGTFDPIHRGHVEVAAAVRQHFALDRICLVPAAQPPHKRTLTAAADRLAMARLAVTGRPGWEVSDVELKRQGPSYTIDTVAHFQRQGPAGTRLFFLLGTDAFLEFNTWKAYNALVKEVALIVLARGGCDEPSTAALILRIERFMARHFPAGYRWDTAFGAFVHPDSHPVYLFDGPRIAISASEIRQRLAGGQDVRQWLDPAVIDYIEREGLYR
ncbi:MAG: nicotinate (nicotinamide) nucleotide adenylyltransferase [Deltaproteobacteria bacterium]|nr:nicotinate (nicotinamide) nucleotide adenylyltransferase [Deltaproteobacteria bacterium]MBW2356654.1 nicotinate (nicotinamide) nucleotide adenylyltransferase [Deltaproteobacteria bacterium]